MAESSNSKEMTSKRINPFSVLKEDEIRLILDRLPLQCLLKCRTLDKAFNYLITNTGNGIHRSTRANAMIGFFLKSCKLGTSEYVEVESNGIISPLCLLDFGGKDGMEIMDVCHGMVLCRFMKRKRNTLIDRCAVNNPATGKWDTLPRTERPVSRAVLQYNPAVSLENYTVVFCLPETIEILEGCNFVIFRSVNSIGTWIHGDPLTIPFSVHEWGTTFLNGWTYWIGFHPSIFLHAITPGGNDFTVARMPDYSNVPNMTDGLCRRKIGVSGGILHFAVVEQKYGLRVWSLKLNGRWQVEKVISLEDLSTKLPPKFESATSLALASGLDIQGFHPHEEVIFVKLAQVKKENILSFNWSNNVMSHVYTLKTVGRTILYPYIPSASKSLKKGYPHPVVHSK